MAKQEHKYAQVLRWIADGEELQTQCGNGDWFDTEHNGALMDICEGLNPGRFRIKPRTIRVNGVEVPAPERVAPNEGAAYYVATPHNEEFCSETTWTSHRLALLWLSRGLVYLRKEDAISRAKAMLLTKE